jgi:uncharacterized protein (TIGR00369 family)
MDMEKTQPRRPLEEFRAILAEGRQPVPLASLLGFRLVELEEGRAVVEIEADGRHGNIIGTLHGGVLATIADSAMGLAHAATLEAAVKSTTVELKINFLRPFKEGRLRAISRAVKRGRTLSLMECDILDDQDRLVARASGTWMAVPETGSIRI